MEVEVEVEADKLGTVIELAELTLCLLMLSVLLIALLLGDVHSDARADLGSRPSDTMQEQVTSVPKTPGLNPTLPPIGHEKSEAKVTADVDELDVPAAAAKQSAPDLLDLF
ncbi:MAG: hypothetical protein ACFHX7_22080 [Pseudomonadota bacterium]